VRTLEKRQGMQSGCPEEIALKQGWISKEMLQEAAEKYSKNSYGQYLFGLLGREIDPSPRY
jgi:glucose-1-phosphate thymidylyltransferase